MLICLTDKYNILKRIIPVKVICNKICNINDTTPNNKLLKSFIKKNIDASITFLDSYLYCSHFYRCIKTTNTVILCKDKNINIVGIVTSSELQLKSREEICSCGNVYNKLWNFSPAADSFMTLYKKGEKLFLGYLF